MPSYPIPAFTTPQVLDPFVVPGPFTKLSLWLDMASLVGTMRLLVEVSQDSGNSWKQLVGETGCVPGINQRTLQPRTREEFTAGWGRPFVNALVRVTVAGPQPWSCAGGMMELT